jgi:hypothetical protein
MLDARGMTVLRGILGAVAGFAIGVVIHVAFWNDEGWADIIPFALAVAGVPLGVALVRAAETAAIRCKCAAMARAIWG